MSFNYSDSVRQHKEGAGSGFGAPPKVPVHAHGTFSNGWAPNPDTPPTVQWLVVDCCGKWPQHNESAINAPCGHVIHESCILDLAHAYIIEGCPICTKKSTYSTRRGKDK